jgi:integrase
MPARPQFQPVVTRDGWMVSIPGNMTAGGKRVRKFFPAEGDAQKFARGLRKKYHEGERGGHISHELAVMAGAAAELLEPHGITIMDAARAFVAGLGAEDAAGAETFRDRYRRALLDGEAHWSAIYARDMGKLENWVGSAFMALRCSQIKGPVIAEALREHGAAAQSTLDHRTRYVMAIVNFKPRHRKQTTVALMTLQQVAAMLRAAATAEERRAVALLVFAGIRPDAEDGEMTRLDWAAVGAAEIYVAGEVAKTGTDRHVPLTPRLRRLLRGHPAAGPVIPPNWRRVYRRLRQAAGLKREQDVTRHTFASHFLAAYGEEATKQAMGHTEGSRTLFRHYRRAVVAAAGVKFFR